MSAQPHPFFAWSYGDKQFYICSAADRVEAVRKMTDLDQLRACLEVDGLQKTVERAVQARIKKLEKTL